jgi:hypothetical protein
VQCWGFNAGSVTHPIRSGELVKQRALVLDAEQQLFTARRDLADARHAYLLARIQLKYFAGLLNEQDLRALARYFQPSA